VERHQLQARHQPASGVAYLGQALGCALSRAVVIKTSM
jgi:hypothetical protein